ncbi:meteorin-like protein [Chanos chanos]|uniref:Meteorin-like protein n=1 Tax=Chanos chanos TaxID=29144 RepID=A0A6J2VX74_CHACN|nr:meteorin-like protein [Chanos chanos]
MISPVITYLAAVVLLWRRGSAQYSSDQCSWRGSGLSHETHARDVEQVYLRCSQGSLEWLYPTGAIIVNLRPNTDPPGGTHLHACIKPSTASRGATLYVERSGELRLLLTEEEQAQGKIRCFNLQEGALFVEASAHLDISRKITAFQYELIHNGGATPGDEPYSLTAPCRPCSDEDILMAVCTSDFVGRGSIEGVEEEAEQVSVVVQLTRLFRQKSGVFAAGGRGRGRAWWSGRVRTGPRCGVQRGEGDFLFVGSVRFGEAWLGCAPRYKDFLRLYRAAQETGTNPCHMDTA